MLVGDYQRKMVLQWLVTINLNLQPESRYDPQYPFDLESDSCAPHEQESLVYSRLAILEKMIHL